MHGIALIVMLACVGFVAPTQAAFKDPLDIPARTMEAPEKRPVQAIAEVGDRLIAVGARGLIIVSDDKGATWQQSPSPVQNDLLAVQFPTDSQGWAIGHDGVVLHSADAGKTWQKQLDGRVARELFTAFYQPRAEGGDAASQAALESVERNYSTGPTLPLLDVWFEDVDRGFAVGAFGIVIATTDGGRTWQPWFDRIDNEDQLHLNSIRSIAGDLYIAAEHGTLFRLDRSAQRFEKIETGYGGSFFGLTGSARVLLAYGLEGSVYRSIDQGESWKRLETGTTASITGASRMPDSDRFVLTTAVGELLVSDATGTALSLEKPRRPSRFTGVASLVGGQLLITSMEGMRSLSLEELMAQR